MAQGSNSPTFLHQKRKMTDDLTVIFALLEFMRVKAAHKTYMNLTPDA